jgi:hypothetical protein
VQAPTTAANAAAIYTLTGTAKLNGLDPELYLRHVLERIAVSNRRDESLIDLRYATPR